MSKQLTVKTTSYHLGKPQEMSQLAVLLKDYVQKNNLSVPIKGKQYTQVEGWQFAGGMLGMLPLVTEVIDLSNESEIKWKAIVEIVSSKDGKVLGRGFALCSNKEPSKKSFDEYAIQSMAQTRAIGKAYRNLIGWVMKMSGFESTPAEEISPEVVNDMFDKASAQILACKNPQTLEQYGEKIKGSKKYSSEQKKELDDLINTQIDFINEKASE